MDHHANVSEGAAIVRENNVSGLEKRHVVVRLETVPVVLQLWGPEVLPEDLVTPSLVLVNPPIRHNVSLEAERPKGG